RFFRFHAHYGAGGMDAAGLDACAALAGRLDILSVERVRDELLKLLAATDPVPTLQAMHRARVLRHVLPEFVDFERLIILVDVARRLVRIDPIRRLAALLPQDPDTVAQAAARLKLSNVQARRLDAIAAPEPDVAPGLGDARLRQALYRYGAEPIIDRTLLAATVDDVAALKELIDTAESWRCPTFPVSGDDLKALGHREGQGLGRALKRLEELWIGSDFKMSRETLLAALGDVGQP
ncbi:MAG: CCA tRNA nucleotidyltransferase, partial [Sphingomonadales bacterium]|nr:CCA tRNA nucleotidyltransferase [Sphingomonadales bacterium]